MKCKDLDIKPCSYCINYTDGFCNLKYIDMIISESIANLSKEQIVAWIKQHTILDGTIFSIPAYIHLTIAILSLRCPEYLDMYEKYLLLK